MANCLVTKLKSVIDNPNLSKLGEIRIKIDFTSDNTVLSHWLNAIEPVEIRVTGNAYFTDSTGSENLGQSINAPSDDVGEFIYIIDQTREIVDFVLQKYEIDSFGSLARGTDTRFQISSTNVFKNWYNLRVLKVEHDITGDFAVLPKSLMNIYLLNVPVTTDTLSEYINSLTLYLDRCICSGDIKNLASLTNMRICRIRNYYGGDNVYGEINEMIQNMIDIYHRYLGLLKFIPAHRYDVTLNGVSLVDDIGVDINIKSATMYTTTYNNVTTTWIKSGDVWSIQS